MVDLIAVTKERFYAVVGPLNVHPHSERDHSRWELPNRTVIGMTTPGYACLGEKTYRLRTDLAGAR